jgi:hypothetical protein
VGSAGSGGRAACLTSFTLRSVSAQPPARKDCSVAFVVQNNRWLSRALRLDKRKNMGKAKKTRKFAEVKRMLNPKDDRIKALRGEQQKKKVPPAAAAACVRAACAGRSTG